MIMSVRGDGTAREPRVAGVHGPDLHAFERTQKPAILQRLQKCIHVVDQLIKWSPSHNSVLRRATTGSMTRILPSPNGEVCGHVTRLNR